MRVAGGAPSTELRRDASDTLIRLKVNEEVYEGELDPRDERHIRLHKHE